MTKKAVKDLFRTWRKEHNNRKPNRVIVKMHWENEPERQLVETIGIEPERYWFDHDNAVILCWVSAIQGFMGLTELTKPVNGTGFIVDEVLEFYKI